MVISAAAIGLIVSLVGTAASVATQVESTRQQREALEREGALRRQEAQRAEIKFRHDADRLQKQQRVAFLKGGVRIGEGTPLKVAEETAGLAELEALAIRSQGQGEAQAKFEEAQAVSSAGKIQAGTTFLSGLGTAAGKAKQAGIIS
jgi:hypothetical protein